MAEVKLTPDAAGEVTKLPRTIRDRMLRLFERLGHWPGVSRAKPLSGDLAGHWWMRTGDYRLQFYVKGDRLVMEKIGHRDGFYE